MEVLLKKPVRKLGKAGDIVSVKCGYGRNYLIPQEMAVRATKNTLIEFAAKQQELVLHNQEAKTFAESVSKIVIGKKLIFITQSSADGRLFGSVSAKVIAAKLQESVEHKIDYSNILLETPIKTIGVHKVNFSMHPEVVNELFVIVARTSSEAQEMSMTADKSNVEDASSQKDEA